VASDFKSITNLYNDETPWIIMAYNWMFQTVLRKFSGRELKSDALEIYFPLSVGI